MKHAHHSIFVAAIHSKNKLQVTFYSKKDQMQVTRVSAPMDFGPIAKETLKIDRYHFWDFTSPSAPHTECLEASQIQSISLLDETFDPKYFVSWTPNWQVQRNWGQFS